MCQQTLLAKGWVGLTKWYIGTNFKRVLLHTHKPSEKSTDLSPVHDTERILWLSWLGLDCVIISQGIMPRKVVFLFLVLQVT